MELALDYAPLMSGEVRASWAQDNEAEPKDMQPVPVRDDTYYFEVIIFKVEETLFRVPKNGFDVAGSFFETMFSLPGSGEDGVQVDGMDDWHPILLEGISKAHFRSFLRVMYPFKPGYSSKSYDDWVGALNLATMWEFPDLRKQAIEALSALLENKDITEKILLAKEYRVKQWLIDGYMALVTQSQRLDLPIMRAASIDNFTLANLFFIREVLVMPPMNETTGYCNYCGQYGGNCRPAVCSTQGHEANLSLARQEIDKAFNLELAAME